MKLQELRQIIKEEISKSNIIDLYTSPEGIKDVETKSHIFTIDYPIKNRVNVLDNNYVHKILPKSPNSSSLIYKDGKYYYSINKKYVKLDGKMLIPDDDIKLDINNFKLQITNKMKEINKTLEGDLNINNVNDIIDQLSGLKRTLMRMKGIVNRN